MALSLPQLNLSMTFDSFGKLGDYQLDEVKEADVIYGMGGDFDGDRVRLRMRHLMKGNKRGKRRAKAKRTTSIQNTWFYYV